MHANECKCKNKPSCCCQKLNQPIKKNQIKNLEDDDVKEFIKNNLAIEEWMSEIKKQINSNCTCTGDQKFECPCCSETKKKMSTDLIDKIFYDICEVENGSRFLNKIKDFITKKNDKTVKCENQLKLLDEKDKEKSGEGYDFILSIFSLNELKNAGWELNYINEKNRNKEFIKELLEIGRILIGVIGYENVGKTHILNKLVRAYLPCGYNHHTEGLSFKISNDPKYPIICVDSAGCGKPIPYCQDKNQIVFEAESKAKTEKKIEKANDKIMTETFIQDFILENSNIILIVVGQMNQDYQKMVERVIQQYRNKKIFLIHNFSNLSLIESVNDKIKRDILEIFDVTEEVLITNNMKPNENMNRNTKQYIQKKIGKEEHYICHLIYAKEMSEAGNYFNQNTIEALNYHIYSVNDRNKFNLTDMLNNFIAKERLKNYVSFPNNNSEDKLLNEGLKFVEEKNFLTLNKHVEFSVKQGLFNVFGNLIMENKSDLLYDPPYRVYQSEEAYKILFSIPGKKEEDTIEIQKLNDDGKKGLLIEGN